MGHAERSNSNPLKGYPRMAPNKFYGKGTLSLGKFYRSRLIAGKLNEDKEEDFCQEPMVLED